MNSHLQFYISNWCYGNVTLTKKLQKTTDEIVQKIFGLQSSSVIANLRSKHKLYTGCP